MNTTPNTNTLYVPVHKRTPKPNASPVNKHTQLTQESSPVPTSAPISRTGNKSKSNKKNPNKSNKKHPNKTNKKNPKKSTISCNHGAKCEMHKQGTCKFLHPVVETTPESNKSVNCRHGAKCEMHKQGTCKFLHPIVETTTESNKSNICNHGAKCGMHKQGTCKFLHPVVEITTESTIKSVVEHNSTTTWRSIARQVTQHNTQVPLAQVPVISSPSKFDSINLETRLADVECPNGFTCLYKNTTCPFKHPIQTQVQHQPFQPSHYQPLQVSSNFSSKILDMSLMFAMGTNQSIIADLFLQLFHARENMTKPELTMFSDAIQKIPSATLTTAIDTTISDIYGAIHERNEHNDTNTDINPDFDETEFEITSNLSYTNIRAHYKFLTEFLFLFSDHQLFEFYNIKRCIKQSMHEDNHRNLFYEFDTDDEL